ncbi:hypothetical protein [Nostocoides sp. F2B08]|uniref:hypothetical protein n=1 Tax=Nostocoides sp. F2B08 TaxID=2653936 RepID=UPI00186ADD94|nr:hypothetical protein [Tetrasphaera sp. F2B08]
MTRPTQHLASIATIAAAALALSACDSAGSDTPTATASTPSATSTSPTATSTPTSTASPEEVAIAAAEKKIPEYFAVADRSLQDPDTFKLDDFKGVAISSALVDLENRFSVFTGQMLTQTGAAKVESIENPRVALQFDLEKSPPDVPTVQLDVCVDVSKINMVNEAGESQIPATRAPRQLWLIGVSNYEYPSPDDWRVSFTDTQGGKTC